MESATLRRPPAVPAIVQLSLIALLVTLAAIAWALTENRMGGMDAGPGTDPGTLGFFLGTWIVMMAAMMFPSIAPMVVMHVRIQDGKRERDLQVPIGTTTLFVAGYLISWAGAGLLAYALIQLGEALLGDALSWDQGGPYLAGGIIVAAAAYQLTPLKDACLRHCRSPFMFIIQYWRPGRWGALRIGLLHGGWCVGCCWMLMAALFALGVMSLGWMAFIAALIAIEKLLPWRTIANRGIAVLLLALGLGVAFTPSDVPGLTLPNSAEAHQAMESMGMEEKSMDDPDRSMESGVGNDSMSKGRSQGFRRDSTTHNAGGETMNQAPMP
jgi:predicted metal-binding membrane protein